MITALNFNINGIIPLFRPRKDFKLSLVIDACRQLNSSNLSSEIDIWYFNAFDFDFIPRIHLIELIRGFLDLASNYGHTEPN